MMSEQSRLGEKILAVRSAKGASFVDLVELAGLDRKKAFRFADLAGVDLRGQRLEGFDFTGADLRAAFLEGADFSGAVIDGTRFDERVSAQILPEKPEDLASLPDRALLKLMRRVGLDEALQLYKRIESLERGTPALLAELIKRSPDDRQALQILRSFFMMHWAGPRAYTLFKAFTAKGTAPITLNDALELTGYVPAKASQVMALLKDARDFETADFIYKRFERYCSSEHLALLGSHVRSPADYGHLLDLAARFTGGHDKHLMALRALPNARMIRSALEHYAPNEVSQSPMVHVILAEKTRRADEAIDLILNGPLTDRPLTRILNAAMDSLPPLEASRLVQILASDEPPLRVGGQIWTDLLLTLYLKRSDADWRLEIFDKYLQWHVSATDLSARRTQKKLRFRDLVELGSMFATIAELDLRAEFSDLVRKRSDELVLHHGVRASCTTSRLEASDAIQAFRTLSRRSRKRQ